MFNSVMEQLAQMLPPDTDVRAAYDAGSEEDCTFILRLCMFLTTFFKGHLSLVESDAIGGDTASVTSQALDQGMNVLVKISEVQVRHHCCCCCCCCLTPCVITLIYMQFGR